MDFLIRPCDRDGLGNPSYGIGELLRWIVSATQPAPEAEAGSASAEPAEAHAGADWWDVRASLDGDGEAYARLVNRYQRPVAAYMWRFTRDRRQWEELVQDVFVEAYLSLRGFRGRSPWLHWLRKIATRVGYRYWRQRARRRIEVPLPLEGWEGIGQHDGQAAGPGEAAEAAALVHAVLDRMSVRDRLVLTLLHLEGCSVAEAARLSGWTQTMVKVQAHRARKRLKKLLEERS